MAYKTTEDSSELNCSDSYVVQHFITTILYLWEAICEAIDAGVIMEFFALCDGKVATYLQTQRNMLTHSSQAFSMYHHHYDIIMNHLHMTSVT